MAVSVEKVQFEITAQDQATRVFKALQGAMGSLQSSFIALGSALAGGAVFTKFLSDAISVRSALDDLADTTGDSVKTLDGLRRVAQVAGVDMDRLGGALTKLGKNLNSADDDGKAAGEAIKAIGLDIEALRAKKPGEAMFEIALALNKFEDGASKVAVAMALMGKEGAKMLPYMKDLAEEGQLNGRITNEQAAAAEALEKSWRRLIMASADGKDALTTNMIPALTDITRAMTEAYKESGLLMAAWVGLGGVAANVQKQTAADRLKTVDKNIEGLKSRLDRLNDRPGPYARINDVRKAGTEAALSAALSERAQLMAALNPPAQDISGGAKAQLKFTIPKIDRGGAGGSEKVSAFDTLKRQMEEQLAKTGELTEYEKLLGLLQTERYKGLTAAQKQELYLLAGKIDLAREDARMEKEHDQVLKQHAEEQTRRALQEAEALNRLRDKYIDLADPLEKYRKELEEIDALQEKGLLTAAQALEARWKVNEQMDGEFDKLKKDVDKTNDLAKELGLTFSSAFEEAIVGGKKFSDVLRSLAKDIVKMFVRDQVTKPVASAVGNILSGFDWGKIFGGFGGTPIATASGGPRSGGDLLMVGEQGPELWVPETNGTMIPNHKLGELGGGITVVQNMSFGSDVNRSTLVEWGRQVKNETIAAVADARLRGGAFSGAMGR